jgi:hypothetical protein
MKKICFPGVEVLRVFHATEPSAAYSTFDVHESSFWEFARRPLLMVKR